MEKDTQLSSSSLFHYTEQLSFLRNVIEDGFKISYSLEKFDNQSSGEKVLKAFAKLSGSVYPKKKGHVKIAIPMVCFCDIPLNLVSKHSKMYGRYAIGLKKDWGYDSAINPILYLSPNSEAQVLLKNLQRDCDSNKTVKGYEEIIQALNRLRFYTKPYKGEYFYRGKKHKNHKYYDEREWRYIPPVMLESKQFLSKAEYSKRKKDSIGPIFIKGETAKINFKKKDITYLICPESEKDELKKIMKDKFRVDNKWFDKRYRNIDNLQTII